MFLQFRSLQPRNYGAIGNFVFIALLAVSGQAVHANAARILHSPDGRLTVQIQMPSPGSTDTPRWSATFGGKAILSNCRLSLNVAEGGDLLAGVQVQEERSHSLDKRIRVLFGKVDSANDRYCELRFTLENPQHRRVTVVFRCYNDAIAFRYEVPKQAGMKRLIVMEEGTSFVPVGNPRAYVQYLENYQTSHEHNVTKTPLQDIKPNTLLDMPLTLAREDGTCLAITEAALRHYAGMSLMRLTNAGEPAELVCRLTPRPDGTKVVRDLPMQTPWRVVLVGERAGALLESNTLYCLNAPNAIGDTAWIKPGKLTFSWWNGNVVTEGKPVRRFSAWKRSGRT